VSLRGGQFVITERTLQEDAHKGSEGRLTSKSSMRPLDSVVSETHTTTLIETDEPEAAAGRQCF
jgi:hypothetical protein